MESLLTPDLTNPLLQNHIEFLSTHRGNVLFQNNTYTVQSEKQAFTFAIPSNITEIIQFEELFKTFYLLPSCIHFERFLQKKGYENTGALNYMNAQISSCNWSINKEIIIKKAVNEEDFEEFSEIQGRGFCETEAIYKEWYPWMRNANLRNLNNKSQSFYIGYINNKPVGVVLTVSNKNIAGIYAVATLPDYRKKGISTSIMKRAIHDALEMGITTAILQVANKSYAESFYTKLGFTSSFIMNIMSRK